jgi:hypothetical protein
LSILNPRLFSFSSFSDPRETKETKHKDDKKEKLALEKSCPIDEKKIPTSDLISDIPEVMKNLICDFLDYDGVCALAQTSKKFSEVASRQLVW